MGKKTHRGKRNPLVAASRQFRHDRDRATPAPEPCEWATVWRTLRDFLPGATVEQLGAAIGWLRFLLAKVEGELEQRRLQQQ